MLYLGPEDVLKAWGIPTNSPTLGGDAWRHLCFAFSLAHDLDDAGEVLELLRAARVGCADPAQWWTSMTEAMRPVCEENPLLLDLLGLPLVPNPFTLALSVARNMQRSARARAGYPA